MPLEINYKKSATVNDVILIRMVMFQLCKDIRMSIFFRISFQSPLILNRLNLKCFHLEFVCCEMVFKPVGQTVSISNQHQSVTGIEFLQAIAAIQKLDFDCLDHCRASCSREKTVEVIATNFLDLADVNCSHFDLHLNLISIKIPDSEGLTRNPSESGYLDFSAFCVSLSAGASTLGASAAGSAAGFGAVTRPDIPLNLRHW